jgi:tetratricopeptide (TPR) repeat protein
VITFARRSSRASGTGVRAVVAALVLVCGLSGLMGCGGNAAVKSARRSLVEGDARAAYEAIAREARESDDTDVLLALAEAAAIVERDSVAHVALARVESRGDGERRKAAEVRERTWRALSAGAQAVIDTLDRAVAADRVEARALLERAERFDPGRAATAASLGSLSLREGRVADADSLFTLAIDRSGDDRRARRPVVTALVRAAAVHRGAGRLDAAVALGRQTIEIAPDDARARFDHGVTLHRLAEATGDTTYYAEAIEQFEAVLEHVPGDVDAGYNLALAQFRLGALDAARETLEGLRSVALLDARVHRLAARLALASDDRDAARGHVVAMRALEGEERLVPISAILVSRDAGHGGAKRFALSGPPALIRAYTERSGSTVEVWFYPSAGRVYGFSAGALVAELGP